MTASHSTRTRILLAVLGLLAVNALLGIAVIVGGSLSDTGGKVIGTSFLIAAACLLGLAGSTVVDRAAPLAAATIVGSGVGVMLVADLIWDGPGGDAVARITGAVCCLTVYGALASLLVSRARAVDSPEVRGAQVLALVGFGVVSLTGVLFSAGVADASGSGMKLAGAALILGILGLLAAPILRKTSSRPDAPAPGVLDAVRLEALVGLRVVAVNGAERDVLVFEDGTCIRSRA